MIIKKDFLGLYVVIGGIYIARPIFGTIFKKEDKVKTKHFTGSNLAGVTFTYENFTKSQGSYEYWVTTINTNEYENKSLKEIEIQTNWYKNYFKGTSFIYEEKNNNFRLNHYIIF